MHNYQIFARFYDALTENVDYEVRSKYISDLFSQYGNVSEVLDLACGTGEMMRYLSAEGYTVSGLDLSEDMLTIAAAKSPDVAFLCADMTDFHLPNRFQGCVCALDSLNHLPDTAAVSKCFRCVFEALQDGGIFIFDVNTVYKHQQVLADRAFLFEDDDYFLAWDNELTDDRRVRMLLDFFVYNGKSYDRYSEEIVETAFTVEELTAALSNGFEVMAIYDDLTHNPPIEDSERIYFICKRKKEWEK